MWLFELNNRVWVSYMEKEFMMVLVWVSMKVVLQLARSVRWPSTQKCTLVNLMCWVNLGCDHFSTNQSFKVGIPRGVSVSGGDWFGCWLCVLRVVGAPPACTSELVSVFFFFFSFLQRHPRDE